MALEKVSEAMVLVNNPQKHLASLKFKPELGPTDGAAALVWHPSTCTPAGGEVVASFGGLLGCGDRGMRLAA